MSTCVLEADIMDPEEICAQYILCGLPDIKNSEIKDLRPIYLLEHTLPSLSWQIKMLNYINLLSVYERYIIQDYIGELYGQMNINLRRIPQDRAELNPLIFNAPSLPNDIITFRCSSNYTLPSIGKNLINKKERLRRELRGQLELEQLDLSLLNIVE